MFLKKIFNKKDSMDNGMYLYTEDEMEKYQQFVIEQFGNYKEVIHEIVSDKIHLDIIVIPPTEEENYYKLVTMGMGAYKMNVPKRLKDRNLERAELVICLPPDWDVKSKKEEDYWPIRQLKSIARVPIGNNTFICEGHTISADANNTPYDKTTKFCSMLLISILNRNGKYIEMDLAKDKKINFYQLFPIYEEELMYILQNGCRAFPISNDDVMPLNMKRESYVTTEEDK